MLEISYYYYRYDLQVFFQTKVFKRWMDSLRMVALILEIRDFTTQNWESKWRGLEEYNVNRF